MKTEEHYLVIGSGSMARRHIDNLNRLFPDSLVASLSFSKKQETLKKINTDVVFKSFQEGLDFKPNFVIEASPSPFHLENACKFLSENIPVLIEKPLCSNLEDFENFKTIFFDKRSIIEVGYCLRYQEAALKFKELLEETHSFGRILSVKVEVGQYLPDWRPGFDYRQSVSANKALGGGVLLELSHELDYLNWFFGKSQSVFCKTLNSGLLGTDVEETADAILMRDNGPVINVHMDFLQRKAHRSCKVITEKGTLIWNLLENQITLEGKDNNLEILFYEPDYNRNDMFLSMLERFKKLANGELTPLVSIEDSLNVMSLVNSMKLSNDLQQSVDIRTY